MEQSKSSASGREGCLYRWTKSEYRECRVPDKENPAPAPLVGPIACGTVPWLGTEFQAAIIQPVSGHIGQPYRGRVWAADAPLLEDLPGIQIIGRAAETHTER